MPGPIKPWLSFEQQLDLLVERGMIVGDRTRALKCLERVGFFRLSGFWYAFRQRNDVVWLEGGGKPGSIEVSKVLAEEFMPNTSFQNAVNLYVFDKKLRLMTMDALERIEIALRVDMTYTLGQLSAIAYTRPELFDSRFTAGGNAKPSRYQEWLQRHEQLVGRSKEAFIEYHKKKYGLPLPLWIVTEVWDFGTLSKLFSGMRAAEQDAISSKYGISNGRIFASWLRSLNYLRNVCAHHGRLWNLNIVDQPRLPSAREISWVEPFSGNPQSQARCFLLLCMTRHVLGVVNPRSSWPQRMKEHIQGFPAVEHLGLSVAGMGAYEGWEEAWSAPIKTPQQLHHLG